MKVSNYFFVSYLIVIILFPVSNVGAQNANSTTNGTLTEENLNLEEQYFSSGNDLFDQGKYQDAISDYDKALSISPQDSDVLYQEGRALNNLGQYDMAITYYNKALYLSPNDTDILRSRGISLENLGNHEGAISSYDKALSIDPKNTDTLYRVGLTLENMTKYNDAISYYDKVLAIDPASTDALYHKGLTLVNLGNISGAIIYYDKALEIDPTNTAILNSKNLAQGKPALEITQGNNLDQGLLEVVLGIFIVILIGIIIVDRLQKRRHKEVLTMVGQGTNIDSMMSPPTNTRKYDDKVNTEKLSQVKFTPPEKRQMTKEDTNYPKEIPKISQEPPTITVMAQHELDMIRKLQEHNIGNSIMLDMMKKALEQNKPVTSVEMNYLKKKYAELTDALRTKDSENN